MNDKCRVVAVGSCKGGVGKTTISVNLAMALRRTGSRVGLFDADLYGPNVPIMLGIRNREDKLPFSMIQKDGNTVSFIPLYSKEKRRYIEPKTKYGVEVASLGFWFGEQQAARDSSFLGGQLVARVFQDVQWGDLDFLIVDLPPGTGGLLQALLQAIHVDGIVLVTTPQDMTLLDTGKSIDLFRGMGIPIIGRVENMSYFVCPKCDERIEVYSTGYDDWHVFDELPVLGAIPLDHAYSKPIDAYHPFTQVILDSPQAKPILEIAERVKTSLEK